MTKAYAVFDASGNIWHSKMGGLAIFTTEQGAEMFRAYLERPSQYTVGPINIKVRRTQERRNDA